MQDAEYKTYRRTNLTCFCITFSVIFTRRYKLHCLLGRGETYDSRNKRKYTQQGQYTAYQRYGRARVAELGFVYGRGRSSASRTVVPAVLVVCAALIISIAGKSAACSVSACICRREYVLFAPVGSNVYKLVGIVRMVDYLGLFFLFCVRSCRSKRLSRLLRCHNCHNA